MLGEGSERPSPAHGLHESVGGTAKPFCNVTARSRTFPPRGSLGVRFALLGDLRGRTHNVSERDYLLWSHRPIPIVPMPPVTSIVRSPISWAS